MSKKVKADLFAGEIELILSEYTQDVTEGMKTVIVEKTKKAAKLLREKSPKRTGKYAKGWTSTVGHARLSSSGTVYNKSSYQLTHLLENGHALRQGGRAPAIPHIAPVNDQIQEELLDDLEKKIGEV